VKNKSTTRTYGAAVSVRGDCLYCPLPLSIDSYFNCLTDCHHCYSRRLNRTWGTDLRPADPEQVRKKLENGLKNKNPRSSLAWALRHKKTLRLGNRTDPYQDAEMEHEVTRRILRHLIDLEWTFVIQTKFLNNMTRDWELLQEAAKKELLIVMPIITPGGSYDWKVLERKRTSSIATRLNIIRQMIDAGWHVGVNGEPFIPGLHTIHQFQKIIRRLKEVGVCSYNTYNLHLNDYVAKQLHSIGLDIEKIWTMNQDKNWAPIQKELCCIAQQEGMILGCPDFVNTGPDWRERTNTCCGIRVPNPSKFNTHTWKRRLQRGKPANRVLRGTWEGIGDKELGKKIVKGVPCDNYTMKDAGMI